MTVAPPAGRRRALVHLARAGHCGRMTLVLGAGASAGFAPIGWDELYVLLAKRLNPAAETKPGGDLPLAFEKLCQNRTDQEIAGHLASILYERTPGRDAVLKMDALARMAIAMARASYGQHLRFHVMTFNYDTHLESAIRRPGFLCVVVWPGRQGYAVDAQ